MKNKIETIRLEKSVCRKCHESNGWIWTDSDENNWNKMNTVNCIGYLSDTCLIPIEISTDMTYDLTNCKYKLEHTVMSQKKDKDYTYEELEDKFSASNKNNGIGKDYDDKPKWTLDCQKKFSFDGSIINIDTRFYPPNYNTNEGGGWGGGSVEVTYGDNIVFKKRYFKPKETIDELMEDVEKYVKEITNKIHGAVKEVLNDD